MDYNSFVIELQKDNKCINNLYEQVIASGPEAFSSYEDYSNTILLLVQKFVNYNDYLHSNNLLQAFRINSNTKGVILNKCDWYQYYSIKIYSKRSIKYYLDNPSIFWETVYSLANNIKSDYIERLDNLLVDTLEFYKVEYKNYPEFLHESMAKFIRYYYSNRAYSPMISAHLSELKSLIKSSKQEEVEKIYDSLPSQNIKEIEFPDNLPVTSEQYKDLENQQIIEKEKEENLYGDISLSEEDSKKMIMIIGDDPFLHDKNVIYGIGKVYNISKRQFEFYTDYERISQEGNNIVNKTQYNGDKYIGIIFGSLPHKTTGNEGASSLIAKVQSEPGFPYYVVCRQNNNSGKPKVTKASFKEALRKIIQNYKSK